MITDTSTHLHQIIEESLQKAISYSDYRRLVAELIEKGQSTGHTQNDNLLEYSKLNDRRMSRWDKTLKVPDDVAAVFENYKGRQLWLVINEGWCGDSAHSVPVMAKLASLTPKIDFKIVLRDENEALMNQFLTNGGKSIPKLIVLNPDSLEVKAEWGPRPTEATRMVQEYKAEHGQLTPEFKEELQLWYNKDRGINTMQDLSALLD